MKFFIPEICDLAEAEKIYAAIREINGKDTTLSDRRIYSISFEHEGRRYIATVGQVFKRLSETVIAILLDARRSCYLVCSATRGVAGGSPYLSGSHEVKSVEYFEE